MPPDDQTNSHNRMRSDSPAPTPRQVTRVGVWLFIASLTMLFAASMLAYVIIRFRNASNPGEGRSAVPLGSLRLPPELWLSTLLVIGVSVALWQALHAVQREQQKPFRRWLSLALGLAAGFIVVQTPAMIQLISVHSSLRGTQSGTALYGLIFVLVLLHALHVVGGIIALIRVVVRGQKGDYDHEHFLPVRHAALYWHFLDLVWLVMFSTFLFTR